MDQIGIAQILKQYNKINNRLDVVAQQVQQSQTVVIDKRGFIYTSNDGSIKFARDNQTREEFVKISEQIYQSTDNGDIVMFDGQSICQRTGQNIRCDFNYRFVKCLRVKRVVESETKYAYIIHSNGQVPDDWVYDCVGYYDLLIEGVIQDNVDIQGSSNLMLSGYLSNIRVKSSNNIIIDSSQFIDIGYDCDSIQIGPQSENIQVGGYCKGIYVGRMCGGESGQIIFSDHCKFIKVGDNSSYKDGQIVFDNGCENIKIGQYCAAYGGSIQFDKYCGSDGGYITLGDYCAAGCDEEVSLPEVIVTSKVPQLVPKGKFTGGRIYFGLSCATGLGALIQLDDYCAYNVGSIRFGERCASCLFQEKGGKSGQIQIGRLSAYAGVISFGQKCAYDGESAQIILGPGTAYSGTMIFDSACAYYGGKINAGQYCAAGGNITLGHQCAWQNGNIIFDDACAWSSGQIKIDDFCAAFGGLIKFGNEAACNGTISVGTFSGYGGKILFDLGCAYSGGQIMIGDRCGCDIYDVGINNNSVGQCGGLIHFKELCASNCGSISMYAGCADQGYVETRDDVETQVSGQIIFGKGCAQNCGRMQIESGCAGSYILNNIVHSGGNIFIGNNCARDGGYFYLGGKAASLETEQLDNYAGLSGTITIKNDCAVGSQIILKDRLAFNGGNVDINEGCKNIQMGQDCASRGTIYIGKNAFNLSFGLQCGSNFGSLTVGDNCGTIKFDDYVAWSYGVVWVGNDCATNGGKISIGYSVCKSQGRLTIANKCADGGYIEIQQFCASGCGDFEGGEIMIQENCSQKMGKIVVQQYTCASTLYTKGGILIIGTGCANEHGQILIGSNCSQGTCMNDNIQCSIVISSMCATNNGIIRIGDNNNGFIQINSNCFRDNQLFIDNNAINRSKLMIYNEIDTKIFIDGMKPDSYLQIGNQQNPEINKLLSIQLPQINLQRNTQTITPDVQKTDFYLWNFDSAEEIEKLGLQQVDLFKIDKNLKGYYIDDEELLQSTKLFKETVPV